ncbi:MAG: hypothetical protein QF849_16560 [Pseudomonadales bacterium]|nr:hypothetical protein [Pseudomonadales bacterium]
MSESLAATSGGTATYWFSSEVSQSGTNDWKKPVRRIVLEPLADLDTELISIGDCITPRTAEEAVLEGLKAGVAI